MLRYFVSGPYNRAARPVAVLLAVCCCLSVAGAQQTLTATQPSVMPQRGFDPTDVARQVGAARLGPSAVSREPSALDGGEFLIDTSITYVGALGVEPAVAFDGENFLLVWEMCTYSANWDDIYGARVTPGGSVLDPAGIRISTKAYASEPAVAFDGTDFLVVWADVDGAGIHGARVTSEGAVLDSVGIAIATATAQWSVFSPAVASDGENSVVVWADRRSGTFDIYGSRVTTAGVVLDPAGIAITTAAKDQMMPSVAFDGTNYLVVWDSVDRFADTAADIHGARVTPAGVVLDTTDIAIATGVGDQPSPVVGFGREDFLVAWANSCGWDSLHNMPLFDLCGARVTSDGVVLDTAGIAISPSASILLGHPDIDSDSENFLVVWEDSGNIYGARVTPAGVVLDTTGFDLATGAGKQWNPAFAFDGENFLAVWEDARGIRGARVSPEGMVLDSTGTIATAANGQFRPALAFGDTSFLGVWEDFRHYTDTCDIYGARVTPSGVVLDSTSIAIAAALLGGNKGYPAIGFDGENFLVVWDDYRGTRGARVSQAGVVLDSAGIDISGGIHPAIGFGGEDFLVVYEARNGSSDWDIYGRRVTPAGVVLDTIAIPIAASPDDQRTPAVAFDGTNFLVVWEDSRGGIWGSRVTPAGVRLDPDGRRITERGVYAKEPAVSFDGTNFLVVWSVSGYYIYGARVSQAGVVLDSAGIAISTAPTHKAGPAVSFDGTNFLVVWVDGTNTSWDCDLCGARVTPAGVVFDEGPVVGQDGAQMYPALARGTGSQVFLVYQGWAGTVGGKTYNTYRTWGKLDVAKLAGIAETMNGEGGTTKPSATIVRGVLLLGDCPRTGTVPKTVLLDISGRKVMELQPGANDVRALSPGVYFVREGPRAASLKPQAVRKIVVTR